MEISCSCLDFTYSEHGRWRPNCLKTGAAAGTAAAAFGWWLVQAPVSVWGACLRLVPGCGWAVQLICYICRYILGWSCICVRSCGSLAGSDDDQTGTI